MNEIIQELRELEKKLISDNLRPRTIITYAVYGSVIYLCICQLPVPELLKDMMLVMQGFWFGEKIGQALKTNGGTK